MSSRGSRAQSWCVRVGIWLALLATVPLSGCSLLFVDGPPKTYTPPQYVHCSSSPGWPVFDTVVAGLELVRTGIAVSASDSAYQGAQISRGADIGFGLAFMTLFAISAGVGYGRVSDCNAAMLGAPMPHPRRVRPPSYYPPPPQPGSAGPSGPPIGYPPPPPPNAAPPPPPIPPAPGAPGVPQQMDNE